MNESEAEAVEEVDLFVKLMRERGLTEAQIAIVLECREDVCNNCWDAMKPCYCHQCYDV